LAKAPGPLASSSVGYEANITMITIPLRDGTFQGESMSLSSENADEAPKSLRWRHVPDIPDDVPVMVFTDMCLDEVLLSRAPTNIAVLIEPPALTATHYEKAVMLEDRFDAIFTYSLEHLRRGGPWRFYPYGGSRIREWGVFDKSKRANASIIVSVKAITEGHRLRHEIVKQFGERLSVFGEPYTEYLDPKPPGLRPFRYSIVVESGRSDYYFTEKLIDCFSQGTVPIYWGCPGIDGFFDEDGIISFKTPDDLAYILASISEWDYHDRLPAICRNLKLARGFRCAEDHLAAEYGWLFEDSEEAAMMRAQRKEQWGALCENQPH